MNFIDPTGEYLQLLFYGLGAYLFYDKVMDGYDFGSRTVDNVGPSGKCASKEDYLDNYEKIYKERIDRVKDQLENSEQFSKESMPDTLKGIPFGSKTQTGVDTIYEFSK